MGAIAYFTVSPWFLGGGLGGVWQVRVVWWLACVSGEVFGSSFWWVGLIQ